eukprot:CAMPEP_0118935580 /NCGR_PEP_ID=MMETSP1169-20130426/15722_1 /TAXON_ID=36882 /ORGANISM="Pyramimonas obovata, Strain CCMP722" /LENGTH=52 /DNA_ID=CAMNT_0006878631 /DNA_START=435 /DNA_END=592 /DNA_ORIENTATION=+
MGAAGKAAAIHSMNDLSPAHEVIHAGTDLLMSSFGSSKKASTAKTRKVQPPM